jgi:membrane protein implicated in regulation of membrane protease activity
MGSKKKVAEQPEPSRAAGACVLLVLGGGALAVVFALSPVAGVLTFWAVACLALWRRVRRTANPAPPPSPERGTDTKPQFTVVEDRPGHCTIQWEGKVNGE